ncbi:phage major capsid protein [Bosea rubneri]|uniref:Phage major capsid protein n=1 Tax=Bosea rubneri TaxID=3075434 RepID=A0ABU3S482_9HYPH|nr:phage major capsid protein [Bosea sp. ZW T0_25]MDU0339577.1 phage major capsid protein [Bosea sp. ZW T0_25]
MKHVSHRALITGAIELKGDDDDPVASVTKALETLSATVDTRLKAVETKGTDPALIARLDAIEAKQNRPNGGDDDGDADAAEETKSFGFYIRQGKEAGADVLKTLRVSSDPQGGYLAPAEFSTEFLKELVEYSPIRAISSVRQTSAPSVIYPARIGRTNAKWKGENQPQEGSEPSFGEAEIAVKELNTFVDISNQLLADSAGAAEREVRESLAEDFALKEGTAFVNGTGGLQPDGFMQDARVPQIPNGHASNLSSDALISILYALPAAYRRNATWVMNGATIATIRKLKDSQGNYLWQPGLQAGQPETILGRPVVDAADMPGATSGEFPIAVGDFSAGYRIIDRQEMSILVNPYLLATNGVTRFHATRRTGGAVIRPAALRKLKMATSV